MHHPNRAHAATALLHLTRPRILSLAYHLALVLHWRTKKQSIPWAVTRPLSTGLPVRTVQIIPYAAAMTPAHWLWRLWNLRLCTRHAWKLDHSFWINWETTDLPARAGVSFSSLLFPSLSECPIGNTLLDAKTHRTPIREWVPLVCLQSLLSRLTFYTPCLTVKNITSLESMPTLMLTYLRRC